MDPNETLKQLRELATFVLDDDAEPFADLTEQAEQLAEHFQALDQWIRKGGFLPASWRVPAQQDPDVCEHCGELTATDCRCSLEIREQGSRVSGE